MALQQHRSCGPAGPTGRGTRIRSSIGSRRFAQAAVPFDSHQSPGGNRGSRVRVVCMAVAGERPVAVTTGASTGIGRCIAQRLEREGWDVFAGVRKKKDGVAIQEGHPRVQPVLLDVTDSKSVESARKQVCDAVGKRGVRALINNAGKVTLAPVEFMPLEIFEDQLQVNLVGAMRVTQAFLPLLRSGQEPGRIVMMSSQSGSVAFPLFAGYNASKFGLEALSDCLRYELYEQGIKVVLIKPGPVKTAIWGKSYDESTALVAKMPSAAQELYATLIHKVTVAAKKAEGKGVTPDAVASVVLEALMAPKPSARYMIGTSATVQMTLRKYLPDRLWDQLVTATLFK